MASFNGAFVLACLMLLSLASAEQMQLQLSPVEKLVDYGFSLNFSQMIPGIEYTGYISATWAVPDSALAGLEGKTITVRVTATADSGSSITFPTSQEAGQKQATAYLSCEASNGHCSANSVLYTEIPIIASIPPGEQQSPNITLQSEIVGAEPAAGTGGNGATAQEGQESATGSTGANATPEANAPAPSQAEQLLQSITGAFTNGSNDSNSSFPSMEMLNFSGNASGNHSFLDSLKPEGDSRDPLGFLGQNPLISLTALVIVIIITGAYLLKSKD